MWAVKRSCNITGRFAASLDLNLNFKFRFFFHDPLDPESAISLQLQVLHWHQ